MRDIAGWFLNDCIAGGFCAILFAVKRRKKNNFLSVSRGYIKNADSVRDFNELLIAEESLVVKRVNNVKKCSIKYRKYF